MAKLLFTDPPFRFAHGASLIETDDGFLIDRLVRRAP